MDKTESMFNRHRQEAEQFDPKDPLPPAQRKLLDANLVFPSQPRFSHKFDSNAQLLATITNKSNRKEFTSDLRLYKEGTISCSCGKPAISGLPCEHNQFHAQQRKMTVDQIVHPKLSTKAWKESYASVKEGFGSVRSMYVFTKSAKICICVHAITHLHVNLFNQYIHMRIYIYMCVYIYIHVYLHILMCVCMTHNYMYVWVYV